MEKPKVPSIRDSLAVVQELLKRLSERVGKSEIEGWDELSEAEQDDALEAHWGEIPALKVAFLWLQVKMVGIGRQKGQRTKLTPEAVSRIKKNGHRNITALAKKLGVTRQTIHNILGPKKKVEPEEPTPPPQKVRTVRYNDERHSPQKG